MIFLCSYTSLSERVKLLRKTRKKTEGFWKLPDVIVKSVKLKTHFFQRQMLENHAKEYRSFLNYVKEGEARKKETKQPYNYVKEYRVKNSECGAHWLGSCARIITNVVLPTAIRGIYSGRMSFPVSGKMSPKTGSPDVKIVKHHSRYWLQFGSEGEMEIVFQNKKTEGYYAKGLEKPLNQLWDEGYCPGGWIIRRSPKIWYFFTGIPRPKDTTTGQYVSAYIWNENSPKVFMVVQPTYNELGIVWRAKFFNEKNQLMVNASTGRPINSITLLHSLSTTRLLSKRANYRLHHVRKAVNILFKTWQRNFNTYRPIVILQENEEPKGITVGKEIRNINPTYMLMKKLQDKLCDVNGRGANIAGIEPFNIVKLRTRLSL